jgi:hypothetical protein
MAEIFPFFAFVTKNGFYWRSRDGLGLTEGWGDEVVAGVGF